MRLDPNPLFRRIIMPWYDSTLLCWMLLLCMVALLLFSITGIVVAMDNPDYHRYVWVPWVLASLCFFVGFSVAYRLVRRYQLSRKDDVVEP